MNNMQPPFELKLCTRLPCRTEVCWQTTCCTAYLLFDGSFILAQSGSPQGIVPILTPKVVYIRAACDFRLLAANSSNFQPESVPDRSSPGWKRPTRPCSMFVGPSLSPQLSARPRRTAARVASDQLACPRARRFAFRSFGLPLRVPTFGDCITCSARMSSAHVVCHVTGAHDLSA